MAENTTETRTAGREQKAFTWKSGYKEAVEPRFEAWAEAQPEGKKAFQDYILYLQTKADSASSQGDLDARIERLGIAPLVDMHKRRAEADVRMIEQIADILEDAKSQAQAEVKDLLAALQKTADTATATAGGLTEEKKALEARLAETADALEAKRAEVAAMAERLETAEKSAADALVKLEKAEADASSTAIALEEARSGLNAARESLNTEKEKTLALTAEKNRMALELEETKRLLAEEATRRSNLQNEVELAKAALETAKEQGDVLTAEREQKRLDLMDANRQLEMAKEHIGTLKADLEKTKADLSGEATKTAKLTEENNEINFALKRAEQEIETQKKQIGKLEESSRELAQKTAELRATEAAMTETKILAATHEAQAKAQAETIAALQKALEATTRGKTNLKTVPDERPKS